ncbi:MAG TPA: FAD-binding oxidoreductase [Planctomycetota bacterium]|nr:FAD-binding oxidoreductase [Planctomycetota bacterium]
MAKRGEMTLPVVRVVDDTPTVRDFRFDLDGVEGFTFTPGQFVTLTTDVPGHGVTTRAYSIASAPTERRFLDLCIKVFPDGVLSKFMFERVEPGYRFTVKGPFGKFVWNEDLGDKLALIGAGTGIAPLASMIRYARDRRLATDVKLLFSNKTESEIIYKDELDRAAASGGPFRVAYTVTRGAGEAWPGYRRRIDRAMLEEVFPDIRERLCYICGAPEMVNDTSRSLRELGLPESAIRSEKYY